MEALQLTRSAGKLTLSLREQLDLVLIQMASIRMLVFKMWIHMGNCTISSRRSLSSNVDHFGLLFMENITLTNLCH